MRPDRNPLRRGTDRLETCLLAGLLAAAAAGAPAAAHAASQAAYLGALQSRHQQLADRYQVEAVLTGSAGPASGYLAAAGTNPTNAAAVVPAAASWTSVEGVARSGAIAARTGSPSGTAVPVWTDRNGYLVSPPLAMEGVTGAGDAAAAGAVTGVAAAWLTAAAATRLLLNRRRMAAWEADWSVTAPAWNRQRG
jgi:hypothetical protein